MPPPNTSDHPNIVLMISHDLGCHIGPYGRAADQTPHLNRLAAEGLCFEKHFVTSPGCSQNLTPCIAQTEEHHGRWTST
jgi:N-sulfoglucosamine sulfohydrolase